VINRYYYSNFSKNGHMAGVTYGRLMDYPYFGLCIANTSYGTPVTAYYDWIFVRKFAANIATTSYDREDFEPVARVTGVQSNTNFSWVSNDNIESKSYGGEGVGDDFVHGADPATFEIKNLPIVDEGYTLLFTVGDKNPSYDPDKYVKNMKITISGGNVHEINVNCDEITPHKKLWVSNIKPAATGTISVKFEDTDATKYWAVGELTVEKGERNIGIRGGDES
jgi:hypothetical protein